MVLLTACTDYIVIRAFDIRSKFWAAYRWEKYESSDCETIRSV